MFASRVTLSVVALTFAAISSTVLADPLPDEFIKFRQAPMVVTTIEGIPYYGHDELSTAYRVPGTTETVYQGKFMADDFADHYDAPIAHIRWWGSYLHQQSALGGVKEFLISIEKDIPADPAGGFSRPGEPILSQVVKLGPIAPLSGTFTEVPIRAPDPLLGEALYEYNAELMCPVPEQRDTVYWLKIVALVDPQRDGPLEWGWHNRDYTVPDPLASTPPAVVPGEHLAGTLPSGEPVYHFQDDAVSGNISLNVLGPCDVPLEQTEFMPQNYVPPYDGPSIIIDYSKDLAFEIYARVPEPGTLALAAMALVAMVALGRRRR